MPCYTLRVRQEICFEHVTACSLPLLLKKEERAGERRHVLSNFPSLQLSPRSFLARRERQNAAGVLRAEHNWSQTRTPLECAGFGSPPSRNGHAGSGARRSHNPKRRGASLPAALQMLVPTILRSAA